MAAEEYLRSREEVGGEKGVGVGSRALTKSLVAELMCSLNIVIPAPARNARGKYGGDPDRPIASKEPWRDGAVVPSLPQPLPH